ARIVAKLPVELAVADIDCTNTRRSTLQETIGESSGGTADINAQMPCNVDLEMIQCSRELYATPAHVGQASQKFDSAVCRDGVPRFVALLSVDKNIAGKNQRPGLLARFHQATLHKQLIDARFHVLRRTMRSASSLNRSARAPKGSRRTCACRRCHSAIVRDF